MRTLNTPIKMNEQLKFLYFDWLLIVFVVFAVSALGRLSLVGPGSWPPLDAGKNTKNNENNEKTIKMTEKKRKNFQFD